jgi:hypothetical protein
VAVKKKLGNKRRKVVATKQKQVAEIKSDNKEE